MYYFIRVPMRVSFFDTSHDDFRGLEAELQQIF